jgi:hypothetical protein
VFSITDFLPIATAQDLEVFLTTPEFMTKFAAALQNSYPVQGKLHGSRGISMLLSTQFKRNYLTEQAKT